MRSRFLQCMCLTLVAGAAAALALPALAGPQDGGSRSAEDGTEDVVRLVDGRTLHGRVISETQHTVTFEVIDRILGLRSKVELPKSRIRTIERDVPVGGARAQETAGSPTPDRSRQPTTRSSEPATDGSRFGQHRREDAGLDVPTFYIVPMKGQMGTDIHGSVYEEVVEDIRRYDPDVVVFELDSSEYPDLMIPEVEDPRESRGLPMIDEYQELVSMIKNELDDVRQVMWIKDSVGFSSMLALAFDEIYMAPEARFWGLRSVIDRTGAEKWSDADVRAKMMAAVSASVKAFLEYGGYSMEFAEAMMWPEKTLSCYFRGREVIWVPNARGEIIVDNEENETLALRAKVAEDLLISQGTVGTLEDLAFLMGYREFRVVEGAGRDHIEDYIERWRRLYEMTQETWTDYQQHRQWASGEDAIKYLGRAKRDLEKIISAMDRYEAIENRWKTDMSMTRLDLVTEVEKIKEQIVSLRRGRGGGAGGGYGGGGFGGGPG